MGFASVKEVIRRFSGLEDRFQAIFVLFRAFSWTFRLELCSSAKGQRLGSTNGVQGRLNVGTMLLLIALLDVASIGGTVCGILISSQGQASTNRTERGHVDTSRDAVASRRHGHRRESRAGPDWCE